MAKETFSSLVDLFKTTSSSTVTLACNVCGNKLGLFRKKKPCAECHRLFCTQCLGRCQDRALRCRNCFILTMRPPVRAQLLTLRVKELQHYLSQHNVSTRGCVEKEDLVNVVLRYANVPANSHAVLNNTAFTGTSNVGSTSGPESHQSAESPTTRVASIIDSDSSSTHSFEMVQKPDPQSSQEDLECVDPSSSSSVLSPEAAGISGFSSDPNRSTLPGEVNRSLEVHADDAGDFNTSNTVDSSESRVLSSMNQQGTTISSPNTFRGTMALITCEADVEALSVKQLKDMLIRHGVNYRGCCEKSELIDRVKVLYRDYHTSRADLEKLELNELCKICMDAPVECVMLECGHMATCTQCGRQLSECPICRQYVVRIVRTFKA